MDAAARVCSAVLVVGLAAAGGALVSWVTLGCCGITVGAALLDSDA